MVKNHLVKECTEGRVLGLLDLALYPMVRISRVGVVLKGSSWKWYLTMDLSSPEGHSMNGSGRPVLSIICISGQCGAGIARKRLGGTASKG